MELRHVLREKMDRNGMVSIRSTWIVVPSWKLWSWALTIILFMWVSVVRITFLSVSPESVEKDRMYSVFFYFFGNIFVLAVVAKYTWKTIRHNTHRNNTKEVYGSIWQFLWIILENKKQHFSFFSPNKVLLCTKRGNNPGDVKSFFPMLQPFCLKEIHTFV